MSASTAQNGDVLVEVENLVVRYPVPRGMLGAVQRRPQVHVRAVEGVSFSLRRGAMLALVGESGCGKTTTAQTVLRLLQEDSGTIRFRGEDVTHLPSRRLRDLRRRMQIIYQDPYESLDPRFRVRATVEEPLVIHGLGSKEERGPEVRRALEQAGLDPPELFLDRYPHQLSGGQRQRVAIAASLVLHPDVLVADEPVSMLDVSVRAGVLSILSELRAQGLGILMITHDLSTAARFADRIAPRTRALSFSHVLYTTGAKLPVAELCALARDHGCLAIVDGAQGAGAMPIDVRALGCHAYASSGHKWLMGPKGTGFLYISPEMSGALDALPLAAGRSAGSDSTGIVNIAGLRAMGAAIDFVRNLGAERIAEHNAALRRELHAELSRFNQVTIPAPAEGPLTSANLAFCLRDGDLEAVRRNLVLRHKVYIRTVHLSGFDGLRASLHAYNGSDDVGRLVESLREELAV